MENTSRQDCARAMGIQISTLEHEKQSIKQDAKRFEDHVRNNRIRLGLEVSRA